MNRLLTGALLAALCIPSAWSLAPASEAATASNVSKVTAQKKRKSTKQSTSAALPADLRTGNAIWFDTPTSSTKGVAPWKINDMAATVDNPDPTWERESLPIGNGSFGGNIIGPVNRERVVLNEKTLWKGGPATGTERYWDMNRHVSDTTLSKIRSLLLEGKNEEAHRLVAKNYRGNTNYDRHVFGCFTGLGEAYVQTGIDESTVKDYVRVLNIDNSLASVQFDAGGTKYRRDYFASYPDSVMVWRFRSTGKTQDLTFSFDTPQQITAVTAAKGGLLYTGTVDNNGMKWAMRVYVRTADGRGKVTPDAANRTIKVTGSNDVEFILAGDTD